MSKHETKAHDLKVVSGISIDGKIYAPGAVALAVPEKLARDLLGRGKVVLATADDVKAAAKAEKGAAAKAEAEDAAAAAAAEAEAKTQTTDKDQTK